MSNVISFEEFKQYRDTKYYKRLFLEKFLYVKLNIGTIVGATKFVDKSDNFLNEVLESLLLENCEVEFTKGYAIVEEILKRNAGSSLYNEASFYVYAMRLNRYLLSFEETKKFKMIDMYINLNGHIDALDEKNTIGDLLPTKWDLIPDNEFIDSYMLCWPSNDDLEKIKNGLKKGISYNENKKY